MPPNKIRYIHLRVHDFPAPGDDQDALLSPFGGTTIAYRLLDEKTIEYAVAECNDKDNYNKKIGRDIATGRLLKKDSPIFVYSAQIGDEVEKVLYEKVEIKEVSHKAIRETILQQYFLSKSLFWEDAEFYLY